MKSRFITSPIWRILHAQHADLASMRDTHQVGENRSIILEGQPKGLQSNATRDTTERWGHKWGEGRIRPCSEQQFRMAWQDRQGLLVHLCAVQSKPEDASSSSLNSCPQGPRQSEVRPPPHPPGVSIHCCNVRQKNNPAQGAEMEYCAIWPCPCAAISCCLSLAVGQTVHRIIYSS